MFCSKGPVKGSNYKINIIINFNILKNCDFSGITITQLVIKAISLLENSGVQIDGIVSDRSSSNRKLWNEFGVSGTRSNLQNSVVHPMNQNQKIYFFSDAPHLIKTVRNKLFNSKTLRVNINN